MRSFVVLFSMIFIFLFSFTSCEKEEAGKGTVKLSITDAPIDADGIAGVYITFTEVQYNSGDSWETFVFEEPQVYNLLDLQRGESAIMGNFELPAGSYSQIRFMLDAPEFSAAPKSNPGCYLMMDDNTTVPIFVPSGGQTGYKAVGPFDVPVNGQVELTADFDVRKSVVKAGVSGKYLLKPTIRLIVGNQAGAISGEVTGIPQDSAIVVYAYEADGYTEGEAADPEGEAIRFPNAVTSDRVDDNDRYHLAYLAAGTYDLVVVSISNAGEFGEVLNVIDDVEVVSGETTNVPVGLTP